MPYFTAADLQYLDYSWQPALNHNDPTHLYFPDNAVFTIQAGEEMVSFINAIARHNGWPADKRSGYKLEAMLRRYLPPFIKGRMAVTDWVAENWDSVAFHR